MKQAFCKNANSNNRWAPKMRTLRSNFRLLLSVALAFAASGNSYGAEITVDEYTISLRGEIKAGDFEEVKRILVSTSSFPNYLTVQSPGGDVQEATEIGTLIRDLAMGVVVDKVCNSACFFILSAGVYRTVGDAVVGIHRPFYRKEYFAGLSLSEAEVRYRELEEKSRSYLKAMGVPTAIVEKMFLMASDEVHDLTGSEREFLSKDSFAYNEWINSKCVPLSSDERRDFNPFDRFDAHPERNYKSAGYYKYLQGKYDLYEECVKDAVRKTRLSVLEQYK